MNENLSKTVKYLKRYRKELVYSLAPVVLVCIVAILIGILSPKPNDNISPSTEGYLFENVNPQFEVGFGDISDANAQYIRFESKGDTTNPFNQEEVTIWDRVKSAFSKKQGIEMRLTEIRFGETNSNFVKDIGQEIVSAIEAMEIDEIKTNTEVIEVGRLLGEIDNNSQSKETVINKDVYPGIDVEYQILEGMGVKEEIIIRDMEEYTSGCGGDNECMLPLNEFVFDLTLDEGVVMHEAWNVVETTYYLTDLDGNYLAHFLPSFAVDDVKARTNDVDMIINHVEGNNYEVVVTLDLDWLFSGARVFPVRIDPSIVHDTTTEFNSGYTYNTEIVTGPKVQLKTDAFETCTGGTITEAEGRTLHTFTSGGTLICDVAVESSILVVAGGGAGGSQATDATITAGGGGGAGGLKFIEDYIVPSGNSTVTVGAGGVSPSVSGQGGSGGSSSFGTLSVTGGGGGGWRGGGPGNGGSGGGAGYNSAGGTGIAGQGFAGGSGNSDDRGGAGGGGAGAVGEDTNDHNGYDGGIGKYYGDILGTSVGDSGWFAGGGGGGACDTYTIGDGGDGGGGDGGVNTTGVAGTDGTGGGGGGSGDHPNVGGDGGDGVVIISYITPLYSGVYRSPEVDLTDTYDLDSIGWTGYGSDSGGGETPHSTTGLVGKWDFNETSGTTADNEGSGTCDGTLSGMTTTGQDVVAGSGWTSNNRRWGDGALMFDGDNDYVTAGSDASIDNISAKTISFWLKVDSYSGDMHIINKGEVWFVAIDQPNSRYIFGQAFSTSNGRWSVPLSAVSVKEWHNIVVTYDRSSTSNNPLWYVDGISIPMTEYNPPSGSPNSDATGNLLLGDSPGYSRHYEGIMDTVSLYSRILTSSEILSNYNSGNIEFRSRTSTDGTSWTDWSGSETSLTNEYYKTVTIESDQVDSTLTNFPVLVSVTHNDYKSTANGGHVAQPDGGDIYFTNSAGTTQYDHEIEKYVPSTGQVIAWVEVPSVSSSADTTFRMYYGDNYSVDKWDVNGTWDSDYERVYHVNDSLDDSASSTTATNSGSTNTTSGHIADGRNFDGTDDYFYTTNLGYPDNVTVSAWINYDTLPSIYGHIVSQGRDGPSSGYHLSLLSDGSVHFAVNTNIAASPEISLSSSILTQGIWYHVVGTYDGSVGNLYINGSLASTSTITAADILYSYSEVLVVGKMSYNHSQPIIYFPFDGQVDEVRVSSKGRSAAWADASCNNQQPSSTFISFGTENTVSSSSELSFPEDSSIQIEYDDDAVSTTPVLHYTLDDTNGDLAGNDIFDSSGNDNDGEINGTTVQDGVIGYSRYLDGIDDAIVLSSPATLPTGNEITVAFWAKGLDSNSTASYLFTAEDSSSNRVMNIHLPWTDGNVYWDAGNSGTSSYDRTSKAISESEYRNKWVHWAFTKDASAGTLKIYLDGALWHSSTGHTRTLSASNKAEIGRVPDFWEGYLDDFRIYDSDLSESEIYALYSLGKDDRTTYSVVSTDVGSNTMLPFWIASDRLGTNMELTYGESEYANYEPDSSTEGLWHMDESINNACSGGTNDVCDSSSNGNDGAISSSPTIVDGVYGKARDFDGGDDFINIGNKSIADNEANLTVSAWVNTNTTDATHHGVFTENFVVFVGQYGTQVSVYLSSDGLTWTHTSNSMGNLTTGMWHNVVWVKEGVSMKVYIDGILTGTMVAPATLGSTSGNNVIGSTIGGTAEWWDGMLDEIRVDSVARSADEVRQMYEVESRAYPITVSFKADLQSGNLITGSGDTSFSIDERSYGTTDYIENLDVGETIIVKENYGGTTYVAQGQIASINTSTGASTVDSWDSDSTFPTAGFTVNATVFKWQREYVDIRYPLDEDINAVTNLAFRKLTNKGASFWVDDVMRASYFDDSTGASFTPISDIRYVQYESILTRWNNDSTLYVSQVDINYSIVRPTTEQIMRHGKWFKNGEPQGFWWAED